jgi:hypothetical protein
MVQKIYGVYFICCIYNYLEIVREQLHEIMDCGLYNDTTELLLFVTMYDEKNSQLQELLREYDTQNKFKIMTTPENLFEKYAIRNYRKYITTEEEDYYIYYFHTKAASKNDNHCGFAKRRRLLNFFLLRKYKIAMALLKEYDAVGCTFLKFPKPHFSGNFWWSKKDHVARLEDNINDNYLAPEMYICSHPDGKYISLMNVNNINLDDEKIMKDILTDVPENNEGDYHYISLC